MQVRVLPGGLKVCTKCKQPKAEGEFVWKNRSEGKRSSHCKMCTRSAVRDHYSQNKPYYRDKVRRREESLRQIIIEAKTGPCSDCGQTFPSRAMDFHHRYAEDKLNNVSQLYKLGNEKRIRAEIAKCELLCAVCHRLRH